MSGTALGWTGVGAGALALGVAAALLHETLRPALEIRRYAEDTLEAATGIVRHTDVAAELGRTGALATAVPELVRAYGARAAR